MIKEGAINAEIGKKDLAKIGGEFKQKTAEKTEKIRHHLLVTEGKLKAAISDLKLSRDMVMFIDGIDYRPEGISYVDYLNCVKGLGEAFWQLNTEFFANIRDSKGRMKIVLLVRPDVFDSLNLYNSNSRLQDNSIFLDWTTTESALRESPLYEAAGKFFSSQQKFDTTAKDAADHYFSASEDNQIFRRLLRTTFQKPRDILTFIKLARTIYVKRLQKGSARKFDTDIVRIPDFTKEFSDYLLGEVRNYSAFYMPPEDFKAFLKFFQYLDGQAEFQFSSFEKAFDEFKKWIRGEKITATVYLRDAEALLQFFYDVNLIGYREDVGDEREKFFHYAFRERSLNNLAPKIKLSGTLMVNSGVAKALDIGLKTRATPRPGTKSVPTKSRRPNNSGMPAGRKRRGKRGP